MLPTGVVFLDRRLNRHVLARRWLDLERALVFCQLRLPMLDTFATDRWLPDLT